MTPDQSFYQLCASEIVVVLIGLVNIQVAVVIQILVPLIIFPGVIDHSPSYQPSLFIASFGLGTIAFATLLLLFRNAFVPLLLMAGFALLSLAIIRLAENRIQRYYGGAS
jgi:hypothetical protein